MLLQADRVAFGYDSALGTRRWALGRTARVPSAQGRVPEKGGLVLNDLSLSVDAGDLVGILGPNGSGKTTLLRLLAGTLRPDSGIVRFDGEDVSEISRMSLARRCAIVPQETHLAFEYTALEIVLMGRYPHLGAFEVEGPEDLDAAMAALEATGTRDLAHRPFQHLSGGEKQRVIIASALAQLDGGPRNAAKRVLFLDEPTASLDLRYQIELAHLVRRLHADQDITIVLTTHDLHFAAAVCDDVVLLRAGQIIAKGSTHEVLTEHRIAELYELEVDRLREFRKLATLG